MASASSSDVLPEPDGPKMSIYSQGRTYTDKPFRRVVRGVGLRDSGDMARGMEYVTLEKRTSTGGGGADMMDVCWEKGAVGGRRGREEGSAMANRLDDQNVKR